MQIIKDEASRVLKISGELEICGAEELRKVLLDLVCEELSPAVDLSEVESCDTTALQLFVSAGKTAARSDKQFKLTGLSDAMRSVSEALAVVLTQPLGGVQDAV